MKNKIWIAVLLLAMACATDTRETPKGYKYRLVKSGEGEVVKAGEFLMLNMVFKDGNDSVWNDTRDQEIPLLLSIRDEKNKDQEEGIDEIFRLLKKGDSVVFSLPAKTLFEKTWGQPVPDQIDSTSNFTFFMGVKDILNKDQVQALEQAIMNEQKTAQMTTDSEILENYLSENNILAEKTESGLRYIITKEGKGEKVVAGQEVKIHYAGYLLDGTLFDTSMESAAKASGTFTEGRPYDPLSLTAGSGQVIQGWEEAIMLMKKGTKMRVWIPSPLAYGPQRRSALIKENSILIFDMEMVEIK